MPDWNDIFTEQGRVFLEPHEDMERLEELFKINNVQKILDLGCGTGRHLIFFSKKGFEISGLDSSPRGIEIAQEWLSEEGIEVETICQRIENKFPYEDNLFDAVISIQVIHHNLMKDIIKTVKEIERVLKKGGYIFITFPFLKGWGCTNDSWDLKRIEKNTYIPQKGKEKGLTHHFFSMNEIEVLFKQFEILENYIDHTNHRAILGIRK
ncbi:MAG: class I SAM-dependent methyltransferase [Candidatus Hermodarchaeota archaeon]